MSDETTRERETVTDRERLIGFADRYLAALAAREPAHQEIPSFGIDSSVRFFARHLGTTRLS